MLRSCRRPSCLLLSEVLAAPLPLDIRSIDHPAPSTVLPLCSAQQVSIAIWTLRSLIVSLVLFCVSTPSHAQPAPTEDQNFRLLIGAHLNQNESSANITTFGQGTIVCGEFTKGSSLNASFLAGMRLPKTFGLTFTPFFEYRDLSSTFTTTPDRDVYIADINLDRRLVTRERRYEGKSTALYLGSEIEVLNIAGFGLGIVPAIGLPLSNGYNEVESITSGNAYYLPSTDTFVVARSSDNFAASSLLADIGVSLSASYRLRNGIVLTPSVRAMFPLVGVGAEQAHSWSVNTFSAGLTLGIDVLTPDAPLEPIPQPQPVDPPVLVEKMSRLEPKRSILTATISAVGLNMDGTEVEEPTLTVERLQVTEAIPTLNYVFFGSGQSVLDSRYAVLSLEETMGFDERTLFALNAEDVHYQILNVIGSRLQRDPKARITLVGTRSVNGESQADLGSARAESISKYLQQTWGITTNRIKIQPRNLPENASDDKTVHGQEENQRVEIIPSKPSIVAPLWANRIERVATPPRIQFEPNITAEADVVSATINVRQGNQILQTFDALDDGSVGEHLWRLSESSMPNGDDSLVYDLFVRDAEGNEARASGSIKLRHVRRDISAYRKDSTATDRKVEKYSLILFDYSSSELAKNQADTIINYVAKSVRPDSRLVITGHTDKTGNDAFNEQLAGQRAARAAELLDKKLRALKKERPDMSVESHGSRDILFDNSKPEGRFLSRTVRVTVEEAPKP
jgi:outer membrane protein OmpA-like peptidoglycan-associated protein